MSVFYTEKSFRVKNASETAPRKRHTDHSVVPRLQCCRSLRILDDRVHASTQEFHFLHIRQLQQIVVRVFRNLWFPLLFCVQKHPSIVPDIRPAVFDQIFLYGYKKHLLGKVQVALRLPPRFFRVFTPPGRIRRLVVPGVHGRRRPLENVKVLGPFSDVRDTLDL